MLLTLDNLADRSQYINARNTFTELLAYGTIPVVNENVSVSQLSSSAGSTVVLSSVFSSRNLQHASHAACCQYLLMLELYGSAISGIITAPVMLSPDEASHNTADS